MNLFPPFFMYFVISASELIGGSDVGIGTIQSLIVVEGNIPIVYSHIPITTQIGPSRSSLHSPEPKGLK